MSERGTDFLTFKLDDYKLAIPVAEVERVVRALAVTSIPDSGDLLYGSFNYHGKIIPVINLRVKFNLPDKELTPEQRFLILTTSKRTIALVTDEVNDVVTITEKEIFEAQGSLTDTSTEDSSLLFSDKRGIAIILDLEDLLSGNLKIQLEKAKEHLTG